MSQLSILSAADKRQFELPPRFTKNERGLYFSLTPEIKRTVSRLQNNDTRAGFILQLAYFRANARFYPVESFRKRDLLTVKSMLKIKNINLDNYQRTLITRHRKIILSLLNWRDQSDETKDILNNYASLKTKDREERSQIIEAIGQGSVITWKHVNLRGEYDFTRKSANDSKFDLDSLRRLKL